MKTIFGIKDFPLTEYAIAANAVLGTRDSGKTYTATEASEELFEAGIPFIWLDPIGVAHNLRIPGKGRGYPVVVAGGQHGDLPLTTASVGEIVRAAMKSNISLVLDLFSRDLSKADWRRIVRETCEILLHENSEYGLRHVFIEEAAEFVPQRVVDGQVFSAVEKLVRMGGNSKVGITLINQRSADLNKSVLELCANVFVHRQKGKNTLLDLKKWLSLTDPDTEKKITASLPDLPSGQCWVMSNELKKPLLIEVPEKNSLHPDRRAAHNPGATKRKPVPADAFVEQMKAALAPKPAMIQKQPSVKAACSIVFTEAQMVENGARGFADGWEQGFLAGHKDGFGRGSTAARLAMKNAADTLQAEYLPPVNIPPAPRAKTQSTGFPKTPAQVNHSATIVPPKSANGGGGGLDGPLQRIIDAIMWWNVMGVEQPAQVQVGFVAKYSHNSGTWATYLAKCRTMGLIEGKGELSLTTEGVRHARTPAAPPTGEALRATVLDRLEGPQRRILEPLLAAYPMTMTQAELAGSAGYSPNSGTWATYLAKVRSLDLATGRGELRAQAWLFPERTNG